MKRLGDSTDLKNGQSRRGRLKREDLALGPYTGVMDVLCPSVQRRRLRFEAARRNPGYGARCKRERMSPDPTIEAIAKSLGVTENELDWYINPSEERIRDIPLAAQERLCLLLTDNVTNLLWFNDGVCFTPSGELIAPDWIVTDRRISNLEMAAQITAASEIYALHSQETTSSELVNVGLPANSWVG